MTTHSSASAAHGADGEVAHPRSHFWKLTIGCVGVVYGDIGTSPLYAVREAITAAADGGVITGEIVMGVLSLIIWSLIIVVTAKYVFILLRADNKGEGGTLSLMALAQRALGRPSGWILGLGILGAALFYGDAMITPAISVLSAVEGIKVATPAFDHYILPLTAAILIGLFLVQSRGTAAVSAFFGPVTALWFVAIGAMGVVHIARDPSVLAVFSPYYALEFTGSHGLMSFFTLGAVFLAVTGAEALYADPDTSGGNRFNSPGSPSSFPRSRSTISGRGRCFFRIRRRSKIRFSYCFPNGRSCRWCCSQPSRR
jgi:KUP system potassium uptake protein